MDTKPTARQHRTSRLVIRALRDGEADVVRAVFAQLSARSVFLRFHTGMPVLTPSAARRLSTVSSGVSAAYVAELDGRPVGLARWHRYPDEPSAAEVAVEVSDRVHRNGIGTLLLRATVESAFLSGVQTLRAQVHPDNRPVLRWLRSAGAQPPARSDDDYRLPIDRARALAIARNAELSAFVIR